MTRPGPCTICGSLSPQQLLDLDRLIADPLRWPKTVWGMFSPPKGGLPASYRRWGAERMALDWYRMQGLEPPVRKTLRAHIRYDVDHVARTPADLYAAGVIRKGRAEPRRLPEDTVLDAGAFVGYFNTGVQVGKAAFEAIVRQINDDIEAGIEVDPKTLLTLAQLGAKFASQQATLVSKGMRFGEDEHEDDGFRGDPDELPKRIDKTTIRQIDGHRSSIKDAGRADRAEYAERVAREGGPSFD